MNAKTRFMNALHHKPVDRPPVSAVVTGITVPMMEKVGIYYPEANKTVDQLSGLAASIWEVCRIEAIKLPFGMTVEAEVLGMDIDYGTRDTLPTDIYPIWNAPEDLVIPDNFLDLGRVPVVLESITRLRKQYDDQVALISSIVGPFALSAKVFGFNNLFPWIITHPERVHQVMEKMNELAILYARAQLEAGADVILLGEATCSGDLISPDTYRDFVLPYHKELCAAIPGPTMLHICGNSSLHAPYIAETGTTGYSFDEGFDMEAARTHLKGKVALAGYVPTVEALLQGTPEIVYQSSLECLANGVDILAPGCSLPQHTPMDHIAAMFRAAEDWVNSKEIRSNPPDVIRGLKPRRGASDGQENRKRKRSRIRDRN